MREQFRYYLGWLMALPWLPALFLQARRVKSTVQRLPAVEATRGALAGPSPLRLLTIGESTVAGVGMPDHETGFTGWIARHVSERTGRGVDWYVVARSGYTASRVRDELLQLVSHAADTTFDLIVIGLGGNDTFQLNSPLRFRRDLIDLIAGIRQRQPHAPIVIASLPPVGSFPAFPPLMQRVLGGLVELHRQVLDDLPRTLDNVRYTADPLRPERWLEGTDRSLSVDDLFCDGVHPSSLTYQFWCRDIVETAGI